MWFVGLFKYVYWFDYLFISLDEIFKKEDMVKMLLIFLSKKYNMVVIILFEGKMVLILDETVVNLFKSKKVYRRST